MLGELLPCGGGGPIPLLKTRLVIGRQSDCDIPLRFATVSSRHCELDFRADCWHVRDLGSRNSTYVNGTKCDAQPLLPNDILSVAKFCYKVAYRSKSEARAKRDESPIADCRLQIADLRSRPAGVFQSAICNPQSAISDPSPLPNGRLVPCGGGDPIPLRQAKIVIGRSSDCDVVLRFATVSGRHCQLEWQEGCSCWLVRDLASRNGTRVDGFPCEAKLLPPGSILGVASQRYHVVYGSPKPGTGTATKGPLFAQSLLEAAGLVHWGEGRGAADEGGEARERERST